ncbi:MAG: hydrogenase maturation nickel metallochaperone HypA [Candidatus Bathyarchaeia archaeon]
MHEYSMTTQIVGNVIREAEKREAKKILEVHLVIGGLTFLNSEQIRFWYRALAKGTILEKSRLRIERKEGIVRCSLCGYEGGFKYEDDPLYHVPFPVLSCPRCGGIVQIVEGKECTIKSIKMVV